MMIRMPSTTGPDAADPGEWHDPVEARSVPSTAGSERFRLGTIDVVVVGAPDAVGAVAAQRVVDVIRKRPRAVLGLPTGATAVPVYRRLVAAYAAGSVSFARVTTFNLDEYHPMEPGDPRSFQAFMRRELFDRVDLDPARTHFPDGLTRDPVGSGDHYEQLIARAGGIDLLLCGIGRNGHVGFNEPPADPSSRTQLVTLSEETRKDNARYFDRPADVPRASVTMGIATILDAREVLLVAFGPEKAVPIAAALAAEPSPRCPASMLQAHSACTAVIDVTAASDLARPAHRARLPR